MPSRKRSLAAIDGEGGEKEHSLQHRIRNMWQFANLCQWIYIFGKAAKIDEAIDVEEIETECLKPNSSVLPDIALALLKLVSSHRGLTHEIFDEQARKQFTKRSSNYNPFGPGATPLKFIDFDIFTKIKVMQQMTQWAMIHPERIRDKMEEQKDSEQTSWRIEPYGWDADDRTYFVLDDNRVYRLTEPPMISKPTKAKKSRASYGSRRSSKRRRTTLNAEEVAETDQEIKEDTPLEDDGLGGMIWECLAVTLDDVRSVVDGFRKTRDENEKILRNQLEKHLVPILEKQEQSRQRRELQRERELTNAAKMANAKRSSRIAGRVEQQRQEEQIREEERHRKEEEESKRREELAQIKMEEERDKRLVSREQRLREREARRVQHEEELAQLSEDSKNLSSNSARVSERRLQVEIEKNKQALKELEDEEEDWIFDCTCGLYGQVDDGAHSIACERCNVWQHSQCVGLSEAAADQPEFHYICASCIRREQEAKRPRPTIKLKLNRPSDSGTRPDPSGSSSHLGLSFSGQDREANGTGYGDHDASNGNVERGLTPLASTPGANVNGIGFPISMVDAHSEVSKEVLGTPKGTPVIPAPVNLDASIQGSPSRSTTITTPMTSFRTPSPSKGIDSFQGDKTAESALSTPQISREIYRAAHEQNGTIPSIAGLSPTKHSPPRPIDSASSNRYKAATPILPPVALSPSPQHQILTPPIKPSEPPRPFENR
ncbi:nasopharyngeal carcinoma susceptibility LZ16 [Fusarium agapanthi]|uniref:Nasopharyngeal carcinoma susceptibility LZ16 n=1 Tax=Fusarium agapanthi TaxID=1803897 RepID=A0A9P5AZU3_9HYPO|nr:nasopharyngeal carcinoma susceptibility LZ16 [Fusarium agapanthi]